jgi:hypothetical protein
MRRDAPESTPWIPAFAGMTGIFVGLAGIFVGLAGISSDWRGFPPE